MNKVYLDTSIYIYYLDSNSQFHDVATELVNKLVRQNSQIVTSPLVYMEFFRHKPLQVNQKLRQDLRRHLMNIPNMIICAIDLVVAGKGAKLAAKYNLKSMDAMHLTSAILEKCDKFYTNDKALKKIEEIEVIALEDIN